MLFLSLIVSTVLLLIANLLARRSGNATATIIGSSMAFVVLPFFTMCLLPAVALQGLLLCVAVIFCRIAHGGYSRFWLLSCWATLLAYGLAGILVAQSEREYARLRALYPYESMEARLPRPRTSPEDRPLLADANLRLARVEEKLPDHAYGFRDYQLEKLHEHTVDLFVNSPGFGIARMSYPSEWSLASNWGRKLIPDQPGSRFRAIWSPGEHQRLSVGDEAPLGDLLEESILDFVNYQGFGYFKDRRHVSGFRVHAFRQTPKPARHWKLQALELVSLLLHDDPEVYVSSKLPQMNKLHNVPTRPLDGFESFGLSQLHKGEDLFTSQSGEGVRMLGAIRSTRQCVACHDRERGDLLGAFSYSLSGDGSRAAD